MAIGESGRRVLRTFQFAPIDIGHFVGQGAPRSAFSEDGILDVDQLIDLGWEIDENAESFVAPTPND